MIEINNLTHKYGQLTALTNVSLSVPEGTLFGLLGPNGGGKSTLFRILSTALLPTQGEITVTGKDVFREPHAVRSQMAVIFQSASIDGKLTVYENLRHYGYCYGLSGRRLRDRIDQLLSQLGLSARRSDRVETLSGGLQRKVEIAKGLLSRPRLVLMDEPSTGLDPTARQDLWDLVKRLNDEQGITFMVTTHLMEEAENCDMVGILDQGRLVATGAPDRLKNQIGGEVVEVKSGSPEKLAESFTQRYGIQSEVVHGSVLFESEDGHTMIPEIIESFPGQIQAVTVRKPTLQDVFVHYTGHGFENGALPVPDEIGPDE